MTNPNQLPLKDIQEKIDNARSILVLLPSFHSVDNMAAGLAFFLSLQKYTEQSEHKKSLTLASATEPTVAYQRLYGVGDITRNLGSKNLVITLKTAYENIEHVSVDEGTKDFNIVVETKSGLPKLDKNDVEFSYRGLDADLVITVGLTTAESAGFLYTQNQTLFSDRETIVICADQRATPFGSLNVLEQSSSGNSELIAKLLRFLKFPVDGDMCTNLIAGIEAATQNFVTKTTADTFAAVSWCMKEGGRRNHLTMPLQQQPGFGNPSFGGMATTNPYSQPPFGSPSPVFGSGSGFGSPYVPQQFSQPIQPLQPQPITPAPNQMPLDDKSDSEAEESEGTQQPTADEDKDDAQQPPQDWLEPKIYRGGQQ